MVIKVKIPHRNLPLRVGIDGGMDRAHALQFPPEIPVGDDFLTSSRRLQDLVDSSEIDGELCSLFREGAQRSRQSSVLLMSI